MRENLFGTRINRFLLAICCAGVLGGCSAFPKISPFVSDRGKLTETRLDNQGVLAFVRDSLDINLSITVDVKNLSTGQKYRIDFNPDFFNYISFHFNFTQIGMLDRKLRRNVISDSVAFFALPAGEYEPVYSVYKVTNMNRLLRGDTRSDMSGYKSAGARFTIERGKVTSFGRVRVDFKRAFLKKTVLNVYSIGVPITDDIRTVHEISASQWEISEQEFRSYWK